MSNADPRTETIIAAAKLMSREEIREMAEFPGPGRSIGPGRHQASDDAALTFCLEILCNHGLQDDSAGTTEFSGTHVARIGDYVLVTDGGGFLTHHETTAAEWHEEALAADRAITY